MCPESDHPIVRSTHLVASHDLYVITVEKWDITCLTACHHLLEVFQCLEEIHAERWEEEVDALVQSTWREKTTKDLLWETKQEYIQEWRRNIQITTTSGYHNLVVRWNMSTLPQGPTNPPHVMERTTYYLMDDKQTDPSVMVLGSEWSSKN